MKKVAIKIGSNIASLQAQRRLGDASSSLEKIYEKLSSGQRINRASDDATGLAISEKLNADSKVFAQGIRNINDSLSLFAIKEQATSSLQTIITRSKELAEQSANGVYSSVQREALNNELQALGAEYNRILETTTFNGMNLFNRDNNQLVTQAGGSQLISSQSADRAVEMDQMIRITVGTDGSESNGSSNASSRGALSADGRYLVFSSSATNLVSGDSNGQTDVFRTDLTTGETVLVSTSSSGVLGNNSSSGSSISADGRYVVFQSNASNLVSGDTNGTNDIFRKDMLTGEIVRVNTSTNGTQASATSSGAAISGDGRYIVFQSDATNLVSGDTNGQTDIFRKDLLTGELVRVSTTSAGAQVNGGLSQVPAISDDGRYVVYQSTATDVVAGDTNGQRDIFRKDMLTGEVIRASTTSAGAQVNGGSSQVPTISGDGRYIVFVSSATDVVSGDTNGVGDIFRKDILTGETILVSSSSTGVFANAVSNSPSVSSDGRYVAFSSSATNLVAGVTGTNVYIKDLLTGQIDVANRSQSDRLPSAGSTPTANLPTLSADGQRIVFQSTFTDQLDGSSTTASRTHIYSTANSMKPAYQLSRFQWADIRTQQSARDALEWLNNYETELNGFSGKIGSTTSRLSVASSVLQASRENYKAAESRIKDADIAAESANLVRTQILQQAAASVLSQANLQPQLALKLLS